ncbi:MAG: glycoside hydrolase family 88 protein [Lachnospiraceae bacterium]|nr:glycoside hydrolase family 88 protein [Lachnospiraceae bacterium]
MEKLISKDFCYGNACILNGCMQMYQATGDRKYLEFVTKYLENVIDEDGNINDSSSEFNIDSINTFRVLFYIHDVTGEEKYIRTIGFVYGRLRELQQNTYKDHRIYPFYMEYETRCNKKANYNDIVAGLSEGIKKADGMAQRMEYLCTVIDVIDAMSIEIFEHYKSLEKLFKEEIKKLLPELTRQEKKSAKGGEKGDFGQSREEVIPFFTAAYAILKACRIGVLSKEKYEETGLGILDAVMPEGMFCFEDVEWSGGETDGAAESVGILMMAYAQKLMMQKQ